MSAPASVEAPATNIEVVLDLETGSASFSYTSQRPGRYEHYRVFRTLGEAQTATARSVTAKRQLISDLGKRVKALTHADVQPAA